MAVSQNGWTVSPADREPMTVGGVLFGDVRGGDVFTILQHVAFRFHTEIEPLIPGQCGSYNPRKIPGTNVWSNHASATAIDCNWQKHPLGARNTFTTAQRATIGHILDECGSVIRWGGHFSNVDEMHFEINAGVTTVHSLALKLTEMETEMTEADFYAWFVKFLSQVADAVENKPVTTQIGRNGEVYLRRILPIITPLLTENNDAIVSAVVSHLPTSGDSTFTLGEIETALRNVLRNGVDATPSV